MLNNKISKYIIIFMIFFMSFIIDVNAEHIVDFSKKGSIEITLEEQEENKGISGAEITIYKIADAKSENSNLVFEYIEQLKECSVDLKKLDEPSAASEISKCITMDVPKYIGTTNDLGIIKFNRLDLGIYLILQTKQVEKYSSIEPFLALIPIDEENKWTYDIKAIPKTEIFKVIDITVRKAWNVDLKYFEKLPEKVTIELYRGEIFIDRIYLSDQNNWQHTWNNLIKSDNYQVKEVDIPEGYTPSYKKQEYIFTVTNSDKLPNTGQMHYPIIILSVLGMMLIVLGYVEQKKGN